MRFDMAIKVGDRLPDATFRIMSPEGPKPVSTNDVFGGRKVVLFAVPGAFTPGCHRKHLPGYVENIAALKAKADAVAVTAVNDVFVMDAWAKASNADGKIEFLSDGNGDFAKALGLEVDASGGGLGLRSKRYAMIVDNGVVKHIAVEEAPSNITVSAADAILKAL
jgi:peroxiredoxin